MALLIVLVLAPSAAAGESAGDAAARARGYGALLASGNTAPASASSAGAASRSASAAAIDDPVGLIGRVGVRLDARADGSRAVAEATATAQDVLLLDGRIAISRLEMTLRVSGEGDAAIVSARADDLRVDGVPHEAGLGARFELAGVGSVVLFEHAVDGEGVARANALRVEVSDPAAPAGLGTPVIGHLEASVTARAPSPAPESPGTAPAGRAAAPTPSSPTPGRTPTREARARSGRPRPTVAAPAAAAPAAPVSLSLPRRPAPPLPLTPTRDYVFPVVGEEASFIDDYGFPRSSTGWHHGNDIFAPSGVPVLAVTDGTLSKVGVNRLGGNRLWLTDDAGNAFYYAHLSAYAPAAVSGTRVRVGEVIGFVGNSGEAITTPPHLHFEIHPAAGDSVNPYPYLLAWRRGGDVPLAFRAAAVAEGAAPAAGAVLVGVEPEVDSPPPVDDGLAQVAP